MLAALTSTWALLLGVALIMLGNGLQGTLLGVRASVESFDTTATGLVMTCYFIGFMLGSTATPRVVRTVGHVSSGGFSPTLDAPAALGFVDSQLAEAGTQLDAIVRDRPVPLVVSDLPLVPHRYIRG